MRKFTQLVVLAGTTATLVLGFAASASADDADGCGEDYVAQVTHSYYDPKPKVEAGQPGQVGVDASETILFVQDATGDTSRSVGCVV